MPPQHGDHIGDDEGGRGPADEQRGDEGHSRHEAQHPARGVRGRSPPRPGTGGAGRAGGRGGGGAGSVTEPVKSQSGWDKAQRRSQDRLPAPRSPETPRERVSQPGQNCAVCPRHTHTLGYASSPPYRAGAPSPVPSHTQGYSLLSHAQVFSLFHTRPWLFLFTGTAHTGLPPPHTLRVSPHTVPSNMQAGTQVYPFAQPGLAS